MRNLKIRDQVLILTLPSLIVLLAAVGLFFYTYRLVNQTAFSTERSQLSAMRAESLLRSASDMRSSVLGYIFTRQASFLQGYETASNSVLQDFAVLKDLASDDPVLVAQLNAIQKDVRDWQIHWAEPALEKAKAERNGEASGSLIKGNERFSGIQQELKQFRGANLRATASRRHASQQAIDAALIWDILLTAIFAALLLLLAYFASRRMVEPVHQFIQAAERLRHGDFEPSLPPATENEFGVLSRSFLHMARALRQDREELAALKRFSEAVTECTSETEVYDQILHALRDRFHPDQVILFKLRPEEDFLEAVASLNPLPAEVQDWPVMEGKHSCKAVRMGRPFRVNDVTTEPLCPGKFALPTGGSYYCGPLIAGGIIIGAVRLHGAAGFWTPDRESLLESYLSTAASVLSNLRLLQSMSEQANIDPLTGIYNRRFCEDYARKLMAMARRKNTPLGFIMMDLDHFKSINDVYGHETGDRILKQFAKTVTQSMRETNLIARFGGEEFVVLLPDTDSKACQLVAERIRKAIAHMSLPAAKEKSIPQITVSLGIAVYPEHGAALEDVLQASDRALYESKRAGRNRVTLYVEETEITG